MTTALIVAAGSGARMGAQTPKAFLPLAGRPIVEHSLAVFDAHPDVEAIVLMVPPGETGRATRIASAYSKVRAVAEGGLLRQETVRLGVDRIRDLGGARDRIVLIHDAARPLVEPSLIDAVLGATRAHGAAVPGIDPADTIKVIEEVGGGLRRAVSTLDRSRLCQVQTPQGFLLTLLEEALGSHGDAAVTDEATLVEAAGHPVMVVAGSPRNFKITTRFDLDLAEGVLGS